MTEAPQRSDEGTALGHRPTGGRSGAGLAARVRAGDAEAFRALFDAHFGELLRHALRFVHAREQAEDVVHDVFLRLWERRGGIDPEANLRAYLFAAVAHRSLDALKRRRLEDRWATEGRAMSGDAGAIAPPDVEQRLESEELATQLRRAIARLPGQQRAVMVLRWHRQMSHREIATALGIAPKTVAIHMGRALKALRAMLPRLLR